VDLDSPKLWARVFAFLLGLKSAGVLSVHVLMLRLPFLFSDQQDTIADRARFAAHTYERMFADVLQLSPREVWIQVAVSVTFAVAGLLAAWLAWRLHPWGRRAILLVVGGQAIAYVVFWAAAGFGGSLTDHDWGEILWYGATISTFLSPAVARLYERTIGQPSAGHGR
jgi:hypothetical protein